TAAVGRRSRGPSLHPEESLVADQWWPARASEPESRLNCAWTSPFAAGSDLLPRMLIFLMQAVPDESVVGGLRAKPWLPAPSGAFNAQKCGAFGEFRYVAGRPSFRAADVS